jgi:hypothetical protein
VPPACIAAWAIARDLGRGVASDSLYRFGAATNPVGNPFLAMKAALMKFGLA